MGAWIINGIEGFDLPLMTNWLESSYWSPGMEPTQAEKGAQNSAVALDVFGAGRELGYAREASNATRFAHIAGVFVDPAYPGRAVAKEIVRHLTRRLKRKGVAHGYLSTGDAQALYRPLGFEPYALPNRTLMTWNRPR